jgi:phosphatidylserine/phosphatidylglycerophosphate/cardiolipin synthase-like enzyme
MRLRRSSQGLTLNVVAGTHVVFFGLNLAAPKRPGLRGFAFKRFDDATGQTIWLRGTKTFASIEPHPALGETFSTLEHPIQSFQWADYSVKPGQAYTYWVSALYGAPDDLEARLEVKAEVVTEREPSLEADIDTWATHTAFFNRGSVATQEYARRFQNRKPSLVGTGAYEWLSRGLLEALLHFVAQAGQGWAIHGAMYEFQWASALQAFRDAKRRGATVQVIVDDIERLESDGVTPKGPWRRNREAIQLAQIKSVCIGREVGTLMHNKFLVLSRDGQPKAVWTGSTNLTENGLFGHANVGHVVRDETVAAAFLDYWKRLRADPPISAPYRDANMTASPLPDPLPVGTTVVFSPRGTRLEALDWYARLAASAKRGLFMTLAFGMDERFRAVYRRDDAVLRMGLLEKSSNASSKERRAQDEAALRAIRQRPNVVLAFGNRIVTNSFDRWLQELEAISNHVHVHWVHTKFMLIDPLGRDPVVVTGSANFSVASTKTNDENMLVIRGDTRIADIYFGEFIRLYSHYAFREALKRDLERHRDHPQLARTWQPHFLLEDDAWWTANFDDTDPSARSARRRYFSGSST